MTAKVVAVGPDSRWVPALMKMLPVPKPAAEPKASRMAMTMESVPSRHAVNTCERYEKSERHVAPWSALRESL